MSENHAVWEDFPFGGEKKSILPCVGSEIYAIV